MKYLCIILILSTNVFAAKHFSLNFMTSIKNNLYRNGEIVETISSRFKNDDQGLRLCESLIKLKNKTRNLKYISKIKIIGGNEKVVFPTNFYVNPKEVCKIGSLLAHNEKIDKKRKAIKIEILVTKGNESYSLPISIKKKKFFMQNYSSLSLSIPSLIETDYADIKIVNMGVITNLKWDFYKIRSLISQTPAEDHQQLSRLKSHLFLVNFIRDNI